MCGIFFSIGFEKLPDSVIDCVSHRGPDGRGWNKLMSANGTVIMAHRRLSIVDLSEDGHQPMSTEDGRFWVTYNGEIYNYLEIRKELEELGYHFKTKTDTEVLLKSYLQWGEACLHRFNGMFAFVIWDDSEKRFFAARDRFGVKPLYYYRQSSRIAFASEIKQFKHLPEWQSVLHQEMANEYLKTGYCDHKQTTLYENVFQVLPGHYLQCKDASNLFDMRCWYNLKDHIKHIDVSDEEAISSFRNLFEDAVRLRLRSDVLVGGCLSGGLDSSSIISMIRSIDKDREIHTFSSVFPGYKVDESNYIDEIVSQKKLVSSKNYPTCQKFLENLDSILYHQDLPFSSTSIFAQWKTFESAKKQGITVLLDGQGADESLLGYPGMLNGIIFEYTRNLDFKSVLEFFKWQSEYSFQPAKKTFLLALQTRYPEIYRFMLNLGRRNEKVWSGNKFKNLAELCKFYFENSLQTLLRYEDRNSMAFATESRLPFLDYRLVELIFSLPVSKKFRNTETKWILRESMRGINIDSVLNRKDKIGFATPEKEWSQEIANPDSFNNIIFKRWLLNEKFL